MWQYRARVEKVVDGDTVDLQVDIGFFVSIDVRARLVRVNAPEMSTSEGPLAKEFARCWVEERAGESEWPFLITSVKAPRRDRYGRWLVDLVAAAEPTVNLSDALLTAGHAAPYVA